MLCVSRSACRPVPASNHAARNRKALQLSVTTFKERKAATTLAMQVVANMKEGITVFGL